MHPKDLSIRDFSYDLPEEKIAAYPLSKRDESKLLAYQKGNITESHYNELDSFLPESTLLIFNNTKVVEARIIFKKPTGGAIELFCLEPDDTYHDVTTAMLQKGTVKWKCLVGGAKKWKEGALEKIISFNGSEIILRATKLVQHSDYFLIEFSWSDNTISFAEVLHHGGVLPLPPYMHRTAEDSDKERYQTIYAKHDGSVAAPTAGLHFTESLFEKFEKKNIRRDFVTLHVGAGTFKPVKANTMEGHEMHAEFIDVRDELIMNLLSHLDKNIVAVGTTSLRTIESLYWLGLKTILHPGILQEDLHITQWEPYELSQGNVTVAEALTSLLIWMKKQDADRLITKTQIIIAPGYHLKIARALITNFHQPQSTLLLLVAAIAGDDWKRIYQHALDNNFRFLSYGDGCLISYTL